MAQKALRTGHGSHRQVVKARKHYTCEGFICGNRAISPGDTYVVAIDYPGSSIGYADAAGHPYRMRLCANCADHAAPLDDFTPNLGYPTPERSAAR